MKQTAALTAAIACLGSALADPPPVMSHQGRLAVSGSNFNGVGFFKFALVNGTATETFWTSDGTGVGSGAGEPAAPVLVTVDHGHYSVLLGTAPMPALPVAAFSDQADIRLRVWFASSFGSPFELLAPDQRITPAGYAFSARQANSLVPAYETGGGQDLTFTGVGGGGALILETSYSQSFATAPSAALGDGWSVEASDRAGFTARAAFVPRVVDPGGVVGAYASLAVVAGRPAISYRDDGEGDLLFARAADSSGSSWPPSAVMRVAGFGSDDVGQFSSLAVVAGRPAIAYYDAGAGDLKFIRAANASGTSWPAVAVTIDGVSANVGRYCSLAVIGGVPAISYTSPNTGELLYAWAADAEGAHWPPANRVAIEGSLGDYRQFTSLAEAAGAPAIATHNLTARDLRYVYLSGADPANPAHWSGVDVDTAGDVGRDPSLAIVGGVPAIAYDDAAGALKFARANEAVGSTWGAAVTVAPAGAGGSLTEAGGRPAVAFHIPSAGGVAFAWAGDAGGVTWPSANRFTIDSGPANVGTHCALAIIDGLPAVAYRDESASALKYAALPPAGWTATTGAAEPILASGVKDGGVRRSMLADDLGVWAKSGDDLFYDQGRVGIGRIPARNALEVEGDASKTTAGSWLANSDARIKTGVRDLEGALEMIRSVRLVDFEYSDAYRAAHPSIAKGRRYPNVIAQQFAGVFPEWVHPSGDPLPDGSGQILQADTYPLTIYSAAAIQELAEENAALRARVEKLEQALEQLLLER